MTPIGWPLDPSWGHLRQLLPAILVAPLVLPLRWLVKSLLAIDDYMTMLTTYSPFLALDPAVRDTLLAELRPALESLHGKSVPLTHTSACVLAQRKMAGVELGGLRPAHRTDHHIADDASSGDGLVHLLDN